MLHTSKDKKRFFDKVDKISQPPCWIWTAGKNRGGYGAFSFGRNNTHAAHRISFLYYKGEIPEGAVVRHTCNNTSCVNPRHLILGTRKRSGVNSGKNHYKAKKLQFKIWNESTGIEMFFDYQFQAAETLGVNSATIYRLLKYKGAKNVDGYQAEYIE